MPVLPQSAAATPPAQTALQEGVTTWPHTRTIEGASVTVYEPQAISWPDRQKLTARAAIAIIPAGQTKQILGTIQLAATTHTDDATSVVSLSDPMLLEAHFPSLDTKRAEQLDAKIRADLPTLEMPHVPLTTILLSLGQSPVAPVLVSNDPPTIFYSSRPASLVVFDGNPVLVPIGQTGLSNAMNTNWDVFVEQGTWYLLNNGIWLSAPAATGPTRRSRVCLQISVGCPRTPILLRSVSSSRPDHRNPRTRCRPSLSAPNPLTSSLRQGRRNSHQLPEPRLNA